MGPHTCRASETGHRLSAKPGGVEERRGPPRLRDHPLRTCCGRTPRRIQSPPLPHTTAHAGDCYGLRRNPARSAAGKTRGCGAAVPRPARSHAYASPTLFPRSAPGLLPARAGSPLAGRDAHPLDDTRSFVVASPLPVPFDPQGLVALQFLSTGYTLLTTPIVPIVHTIIDVRCRQFFLTHFCNEPGQYNAGNFANIYLQNIRNRW